MLYIEPQAGDWRSGFAPRGDDVTVPVCTGVGVPAKLGSPKCVGPVAAPSSDNRTPVPVRTPYRGLDRVVLTSQHPLGAPQKCRFSGPLRRRLWVGPKVCFSQAPQGTLGQLECDPGGWGRQGAQCPDLRGPWSPLPGLPRSPACPEGRTPGLASGTILCGPVAPPALVTSLVLSSNSYTPSAGTHPIHAPF